MGRHTQWRAQAKKMRRKRIRQKIAQARDEMEQAEREKKERSPTYQAWLSEQRALELFAEEEEARLASERNAEWVAEEARAQKAWLDRQEKLALARAERAKQEIRIKEEWEEEQRKAKAAQEEKQRVAEEKIRKQEELMRKIEDFINKGGEMPPEVNIVSVTNPDRPPCPFFSKTGACRFGDRCSRNHSKPAISRVLLIPNFYDHIGLRQMNPDELEAADDWLEYEDSETYQHFLDFYADVLPEWERIGRVSQFKVCCNLEPHLRGNVYVEFESARDAVCAFKQFHGRWYGGRQISVEFVTIDSWRAAICGQFHRHCCPKGRSCNFLHVFRNPRNAFHAADCDRQAWRRKKRRSESSSPDHAFSRSWSRSPEQGFKRSKEWRWSASPSPPPKKIVSSGKREQRLHHERGSSYRREHSYHKGDHGRDRSTERSRDRSRERKSRKKRSDSNGRDTGRDCRYDKRRGDALSVNSDNTPLGSASERSNRTEPKVAMIESDQNENSEGLNVITSQSVQGGTPQNLEELSDKCTEILSAQNQNYLQKCDVREEIDLQSSSEANQPLSLKKCLSDSAKTKHGKKHKKIKRKKEKRSSHRKEKKRKSKHKSRSTSSSSSSGAESSVQSDS